MPEFIRDRALDPKDQFLWAVPLTLEESRQSAEWAKQNPLMVGNPHKWDWTCDECWQNRSCNLAWDSYNTNGDCLLEK